MPFLRPTDWALALKSEHSYAVPIHGTTDIMVELSSARRRRPALLDLSRVEERSQWHHIRTLVTSGAGSPTRAQS